MESKLQAMSLSEVDYKAIISKEEPWTDSAFPATPLSIFNPKDYDPSEPAKYTHVEWKRASEIFPEGFTILPEGDILPEQIKQGAIGDCYFLSCLSALAANQQRIRKKKTHTHRHSI